MKNLYTTFTPGHIVCLALCCGFIFLLCSAYVKSEKRSRFRIVLAGCTLLLSLSRSAFLVLQGQYGINTLPFHLCAMAVYICLFHALSGRTFLWQFLYAFCLPGALLAMLFPDRASFPESRLMAVAFYLLHSLPPAYVLMQLFAGEMRPEAALLPKLFLVLLALALPVYIFNFCTGTNYMYLSSPPKGTPLEFLSFLGPGFVLGYLPIAAVLWLPMYAPFVFKRKKAAD